MISHEMALEPHLRTALQHPQQLIACFPQSTTSRTSHWIQLLNQPAHARAQRCPLVPKQVRIDIVGSELQFIVYFGERIGLVPFLVA
jgi:hypothetical protein